eukprot:SAG22_NODE_1554_length_4137_cov_3.159485_2_plen_235_part_00
MLLGRLRAALEPHAEAIALEYEALVAAAEAPAAVVPQAGASGAAGQWGGLYLWNQGQEFGAAMAACPATCAALGAVGPALLRGSALGYCFFSVLRPGTTIKPHCGATNLRLRCHLPLRVPPAEAAGVCRMRVGGEWREWRHGGSLSISQIRSSVFGLYGLSLRMLNEFGSSAGHLTVFDDSFEHEVEYSGGGDGDGDGGGDAADLAPRVVLLFDVWHPEVDPLERALLCRLFPP